MKYRAADRICVVMALALAGAIGACTSSPTAAGTGGAGGANPDPSGNGGAHAGGNGPLAESSSSSGGSGGGEIGGGGGDVAPRQRVIDFLHSISGSQTVAGIHNRHNPTPSEYTARIHDVTGKYPGLWSGDFLFEQQHIDNRQKMIDQAKTEWSHGALVNVMYHACPPTRGEACDWETDIKSHLSEDQWTDLITDGGTLNSAWKRRLDTIVPFLRDLKDAGVAPMFRPHHEMNQGLFWWGGRTGPGGTRKLYQITHDYLVKSKGLDNMVWVWDVQDLSWDFDEYDPGADYFDVAALDVYGDGFTRAKYDAMQAVAGDKVIAIGECQRLPRADELDGQPSWTFFMSWSELTFSDNTDQEINALYNAPRVLTLDELPGW